ncbi:MAG: aldo/keto reductase [Pirellulaceae bacterium]|nr:aldo/keto reductase [Pirellulaceae bacterium]
MQHKYFQLSDGSAIPALGLGTWQIPAESAGKSVKQAIEIGYRHIDCAKAYGNEASIGVGLSEVIRQGTVKREELWITSKLWNDAHHRENVRPALEQTLADLQLDYLDLYLMHWPVAHRPGILRPESPDGFVSLDDLPLEETWQALIECRESGLCRHIGVANFSIHKLARLSESTGVVPEINQVELHPYLQQSALVEYCARQGIQVTAYSPLGSPTRPNPLRNPQETELLNEPQVREIAERLAVSPGQVLLAWAIQRGTIPIPKSASLTHQQENLAAQSVDLDESALATLASLERQRRYIHGRFWVIPGSPYTLANLWDEEKASPT